MSTSKSTTDSEQSQDESHAAKQANGENQTELLLTIGKRADTFVSTEGEPYARVEVSGHTETLSWRDFRYWLTRTYHRETGHVANPTALAAVLDTLKAFAQEDKRAVYTRVASVDGKLYIDLADTDWRVIEVDGIGWRVLDVSPL